MKKALITLVLGVQTVFIFGQSQSFFTPSDTLNIQRRNTVVITEAALAGTSLVALDQLWYADFDRSSFQTVNDFGDWYGMDKFGHIFSSYQIGRYGYELLEWSGVKEKDRLLYGATLGFTYLLAIEIMDGYSSEWGFSWGDIGANALGTALFVGQQLLWNEQRISMKFSFQSSGFSDLNPNLLGENFSESILKDYNGQTYWLSFNMKSFFKDSFFPKWFNVALGYGAEGMLNGSFQDPDLPVQSPYRQFYFSLDLDLTKIKTSSGFLKTLFSIFNAIKIPSPTLEFTDNGTLKFHYFYF
jgi:hypothetical protein